MGLRGPKKDPNAREIRYERARLKRSYERALKRIVNDMIAEIAAELITEELPGAIQAANKSQRPIKRVYKKKTVKPLAKIKPVEPTIPKVIEIWTKGGKAQYEYNKWMSTEKLSVEGWKSIDVVGLFICNLFQTKRHFGIVADYIPDIKKYTVVYDDETRNRVPKDSLPYLLIKNDAVETTVQDQLREYLISSKYETFPKFTDTA